MLFFCWWWWWLWTSGEWHTSIWVWLCLTCNQSGFQDQFPSKHPDGPLRIHHNFSKCLQRTWKPGYLRTLILPSSWGWGVLGYTRGFWVFCGAPAGSILAGLLSCAFTYGSYMCLSANCQQQALRILNRHQHQFCVAIRHRGRWLGGQLQCKASHQVFEQNRSSSPHQMSPECAEVTDHTLWTFTLIVFRWQGPQRPGHGLTEEQGQNNTKL